LQKKEEDGVQAVHVIGCGKSNRGGNFGRGKGRTRAQHSNQTALREWVEEKWKNRPETKSWITDGTRATYQIRSAENDTLVRGSPEEGGGRNGSGFKIVFANPDAKELVYPRAKGGRGVRWGTQGQRKLVFLGGRGRRGIEII